MSMFFSLGDYFVSMFGHQLYFKVNFNVCCNFSAVFDIFFVFLAYFASFYLLILNVCFHHFSFLSIRQNSQFIYLFFQ